MTSTRIDYSNLVFSLNQEKESIERFKPFEKENKYFYICLDCKNIVEISKSTYKGSKTKNNAFTNVCKKCSHVKRIKNKDSFIICRECHKKFETNPSKNSKARKLGYYECQECYWNKKRVDMKNNKLPEKWEVYYEKCGKTRIVGRKQFVDIQKGKSNNICASCASTKVPIKELWCFKCEKYREVSAGYYFNHRNDEKLICKECFINSKGKWKSESFDNFQNKVTKANKRSKEFKLTTSMLKEIYNNSLINGSPTCYICNIDIKKQWHLEHIIPIIKGGTNHPENIAISCPSCNLKKGGK